MNFLVLYTEIEEQMSFKNIYISFSTLKPLEALPVHLLRAHFIR